MEFGSKIELEDGSRKTEVGRRKSEALGDYPLLSSSCLPIPPSPHPSVSPSTHPSVPQSPSLPIPPSPHPSVPQSPLRPLITTKTFINA